jgi:hypothetical protein
MMDAGEVEIKEGISLTRQTYSILKGKIKYEECGMFKQTEKPRASTLRSRKFGSAFLLQSGCT